MNGQTISVAVPVSPFYREWKRYGHHLEEYGSEFLGTAFMVMCVVVVVAAMFGAGSPLPSLIPAMGARLFLTGLVLGGSGWVVAVSPPGRLSGAHINPAVSFGFWLLGKMHFRDLLGYIASQMAGGVAGAYLGQSLLPQLASEVQTAALRPGQSVNSVQAFAAETAATFVLCLVIYVMVSHKRLLRWTPAAATLVVGVLVCIDGNFSGCGMNPARWFGPAVLAGVWRNFPAYTLAPLAGAALAALPKRLGWLGQPLPHTGKLFHDPGYRSLFKHDHVPSSPPKHASA